MASERVFVSAEGDGKAAGYSPPRCVWWQRVAANERPLRSAVWPGGCVEDDRKGDERSKEGGKEMRTQRGGCQTPLCGVGSPGFSVEPRKGRRSLGNGFKMLPVF